MSRATAAEGSLEMYIDDADAAEASFRVAGDLSLQNQIDFITENIDPSAIDSLTEIVAAFQSADGDINNAITNLADAAGANLSTEVARATSAEGVLTADLSTEVAAREAAVSMEEAARIADVDAEESRAIAAEAGLDAGITGVYNDLTIQIGNVASNANIELESAISVEEEARIADVDAEESRAMAAELVLTNNLSTEVSNRIADVDAEESRATAAELVLTNDLSAEVSTRISQADALYEAVEADLSAEASRATAAEVKLADDMKDAFAGEISHRVAGDLSLQNQIDFITENVDPAALDSLTEIVAAFQSADGDINNAITNLADAAGANLSTEVARAMSAEAVLTSDLSAEVSARIADVDAEESRAIAAEGSLATDLAAEASRAISTENALYEAASANLSTEVTRAIAAEDSLTTALTAVTDAEASIRLAADASLESEIVALPDVDGVTVEVDASNFIRVMETVAAPASGIRTFMGEVDIETILKVNGVDVMAEISAEIARAEAAEGSLEVALSTEVSYLIANTDLGSIDSFAEVVANLDSEIARAENAEASMTTDFVNIYAKHVGIEAPNGTKTVFQLDYQVRTGSELVYLNGLLLTPSQDYNMIPGGAEGQFNVEFAVAPQATDRISAYGVY